MHERIHPLVSVPPEAPPLPRAGIVLTSQALWESVEL
jgi:hypothetical protein